MLSLDQLKIGDTARILGYESGTFQYRHKLLVMGLIPGAQFKLVRIAPFGDPIQIRFKNSFLCIRKSEAKILHLEKVNE
jgi:ferrous iron transport protein A